MSTTFTEAPFTAEDIFYSCPNARGNAGAPTGL